MQQYDKAQPLYQQALEIIKRTSGEQNSSYLTNLNNLANLFYAMEKHEDALPLYEKLIGLTKKIHGEVHPAYAGRLCDLANTYHKMGEYNKALFVSGQALNIMNNEVIEKHPKYIVSLGSLAVLYYRLGLYKTALPLMQKHSNITKQISGKEHPDFAASLNYLGTLYTILGDETEAASLLIKAAAITLNHLSQTYSTLSEQEKLAILKKESIQFDFLPSLLWTREKNFPTLAKQVYVNELILKGMVLEDQQNVLRSIRKTGDSSILQLYDKWRINKLYLGNQQLSPIASRVPYFDSLQYATTQLEHELSQRTIFFRNQLQRQCTTAIDISNKLLQGQAAVEFIRFSLFNKKWTDSILYAAMILLPHDSVPRFIPLCEEKQLIQLLQPSAGYIDDNIAIEQLYGDERGGGPLSDSLYQLIWKPLEKYFKDVHTIYYAPAGLLHRIAFHALRIDATHSLIDKYSLNQVLSTRSVHVPAQVSSKPLSVGVWGNIQYTTGDSITRRYINSDKNNINTTNSLFNFYNSDTRGSRGQGWDPLPSSKREIDSIVKLFQNSNISTTTLSESLASEEAFKMLDAKSPQVLHFATHGFFLPVEKENRKANDDIKPDNAFTVHQNPMFRSGLILAGGNRAWEGKAALPGREDGILTAYEIAHMDLSNTDLVVLSACETALGELQGNEGVIGLQRAFKLAGVKQILVSLWSVYDEPTMELMTLFYRNWLSGQSTREALRNAQINMKIKYPEPYFWAAFVLVD
jgi:CHAT domain-containing protein/tetratricopeptide (TPR) repeat protein